MYVESLNFKRYSQPLPLADQVFNCHTLMYINLKEKIFFGLSEIFFLHILAGLMTDISTSSRLTIEQNNAITKRSLHSIQ